jgi:hypothetical protein
MENIETQRLFDALREAGWTMREGALYAPNGTMWLSEDEPWVGDLRSFRDRMVGRVNRIKQNLEATEGEHAANFERAMVDAAGLVEVLDVLLVRDST